MFEISERVVVIDADKVDMTSMQQPKMVTYLSSSIKETLYPFPYLFTFYCD